MSRRLRKVSNGGVTNCTRTFPTNRYLQRSDQALFRRTLPEFRRFTSVSTAGRSGTISRSTAASTGTPLYLGGERTRRGDEKSQGVGEEDRLVQPQAAGALPSLPISRYASRRRWRIMPGLSWESGGLALSRTGPTPTYFRPKEEILPSTGPIASRSYGSGPRSTDGRE